MSGRAGEIEEENSPAISGRTDIEDAQALAPREAGISSGATDGYLGGRGKNALVRFAYAT
jgi:hypothetical protein